jgi:hypothetical protein
VARQKKLQNHQNLPKIEKNHQNLLKNEKSSLNICLEAPKITKLTQK